MKKLLPNIGFAFVLLLLAMPSGSSPQSNDTGNPILGQTATLLPDGRWLILGGVGTDGPIANALIRDPTTKTITPLPNKLQRPRAWHTATMLPDGTILILGGIGTTGEVLGVVELFDPSTQSFTILPSTDLMPRAYHTATLLTDGEVLIAGGISGSGAVLDRAELWDTATRRSEILPTTLRTARQRQTATLLADGSVLLWGGQDEDGRLLSGGEIYDPELRTFTSVSSAPPSAPFPALMEVSLPDDGATDVPTNALIALRFSRPLRVETLNPTTVTLSGAEAPVPINIVPAEGGMLAFVTPHAPLLPGVRYTLSFNGPTDEAGFPLTSKGITFTTQSASSTTGSLMSPLPAVPQATPSETSAKADLPWRSLPPLQAPAGMTALSGQVLALSGRPLRNVTLQIGGTKTLTDKSGQFLLRGVPSGPQVFVMDGSTANTAKISYAMFSVGVDIRPDITNVLPYTIWMPALDTKHATKIPVPTTKEIVATTPLIPGLEIHIPANVILRLPDGEPLTSLPLTEIPLDRPPFPIPPGMHFFYTPQGHGAKVESVNGGPAPGIQIILPNRHGKAPGTRTDLVTYDAETYDGKTRGWYEYGDGTVSPDGKQIIPDPGVVLYELGCSDGDGGPPGGHDGDNDEDDATGSPGTAPSPGPAPNCNDCEADPISLSTGLAIITKTDLVVSDVLPLSLTRTYRTNDTLSRAFGIGATHNFDLFLVGYDAFCNSVDLVLPDGGRIHYNRTSGTACNNAILEHTASPTRFYKSTLAVNFPADSKITLQDGTIYTFMINNSGSFLNGIQDRYGNRVTITRLLSGVIFPPSITQITSPNGRWIKFTYDTSNRTTQAKDNIGRTVSYDYDASGRLFHVNDAATGITTYTYDTSHRITSITDARGILHLISNIYDQTTGRVTDQTLADGTYHFAYTTDVNGKITQTDVTDPRGFIRRVTFNSSGYIVTDTRALGQPEEQRLTNEWQTATNLLLSVTDNLGTGRKTAYTYYPNGMLQTVTRLAGTLQAVTTSYTYEPMFNQLATVTDPLLHPTTFNYDAQGKLISITNALTKTWNVNLNSDGRPASVTSPAPISATTGFDYDGGDLRATTDPLNRATTRFTDDVGRLMSVANPRSNLTRYVYDALNRLTQITDARNGLTTFGYDPNGNLLSVTDAEHPTTSTTYTYDNMDRLQTRTDPLTLSESYTYDHNGNLKTFTDRKQQVTQFDYDALNRRTKATYQDGSTTTYTYDAGDRLTQLVEKDSTDVVTSTITRGYDDLDRLTSETTPQGSVNYAYDAAGRRTRMTVAGQPDVLYTHDDANQLRTVTQGSAQVVLDYDEAGRRKNLALPNGIGVSYGYDAASQLTSLTYKQGATTLGDLAYTYDLAGNRVKVSGSWARTGIPQPIASATYNAANQQQTFGNTTITYDANGNLTTATDALGSATYTWDARNRLNGITTSDNSLTAGFAYDGKGRRIKKTINGTATGYVYDGPNPVQELSGGTVTANILPGLGIDELFTRTDSAGTRNYLTDALGSTLALADPSGTVQSQYTYDPFGNTTPLGASSTNSYQFTGRENDGTGLYYYRARYYSSVLQRFLSEDSIGFLGGDANLYVYAGGNPVNRIDPTGKAAFLLPALPTLVEAGIEAVAIVGELISGAVVGQTIWDYIFQSRAKPGAKPKNCPTGTKPIDQFPDLSKDDIHNIKEGVGARPKDWVGISPGGDVITGDQNGEAVNNGPTETYLP